MAIAKDYVALILWVDGLRHPVLDGLPLNVDDIKGPPELSREVFDAKRPQMLKCEYSHVFCGTGDLTTQQVFSTTLSPFWTKMDRPRWRKQYLWWRQCCRQ